MVTAAYLRTMAAYNSEMNRRLYGAAARLSDDERRRDRGAFFKSIHATFAHLLWGDRMWMSRFDGWPAPTRPLADAALLYPDFEEMRAARVEADAAIEGWAQRVDPNWLDGDLTWFSGAVQREFTKPRALLVIHMFNHQTHHRGQIHAMLTASGEETGATDLAFIL